LALGGLCAVAAYAQDGDVDPDEDRRMEVVHRQSATVNGAILLDSGSPPPEPIPVEIHCEARSVSQVYTDRKGRFTVILGEESTASMMDASASSQSSAPQGFHSWYGEGSPVGRCQVRVFLAGYQPEMMDLAEDGGISTVEIGTIVLRRLAGTHGAAVSVTSYEAPKEARKLFETAFREAHRKKPNLDAAIHRLSRAVESYSRYAAAWDLMGDCHLLKGDIRAAQKAYESSIAADPDYVPPYAPLIRIAVQDSRWEDVANLAGERLRLARSVESAYFRSLALYQLGSLELAEQALDIARRSPGAERFPQIALVQADIHAAQGRYRQAVAEYEAYLGKLPDSPARSEIEAIVESWKRSGKLVAD
jgi:predicted negative regulator of RcsB-dependent stress response